MFGMSQKPSYLCTVKSQEHDSRQQSKSDLKIIIVLTIKKVIALALLQSEATKRKETRYGRECNTGNPRG